MHAIIIMLGIIISYAIMIQARIACKQLMDMCLQIARGMEWCIEIWQQEIACKIYLFAIQLT